MNRTLLKKKYGFTLIEILIVLGLLSMAALTIMTVFIQEIKVFNRFSGMRDDEEMMIFTERLTRDLRSGARCAAIPWSASEDALSFPSIKAGVEGDNLLTAGLPAKVTYRLDRDKKEITRTETVFPYGADNSTARVIALRVASLKFEILRESEEAVPLRVTVSVEYNRQSKLRTIKKSMMIPVGYRTSGSP